MARRVADLHRTAFVTGASAGLGHAFAEMLLTEGVRVWGTARDKARIGTGAGKPLRSLGCSPDCPPAGAHQAHPSLPLGATPSPGCRPPSSSDLVNEVDSGAASTSQTLQVVPVELDLRDPRAALRAFGEASRQAGGFDLVINNAGYGIFGEFEAVEADMWAGQVEAMLGTSLRISHAAYGEMRGRGRGCLVNISSLAVEFPLPFMSGYNVAKAGLAALSESLIFESRGSPVTVIDFRPGDYRTSFNQAMAHAASAPESVPASDRLARAWTALEANLAAAPAPAAAAAALRRALLRNRSGVVRAGSIFQARVAPLLARWAPAGAVRWATARYYGSV